MYILEEYHDDLMRLPWGQEGQEPGSISLSRALLSSLASFYRLQLHSSQLFACGDHWLSRFRATISIAGRVGQIA